MSTKPTDAPARRRAYAVNVGGVTVGGDAPIALQSMTNTSTMDTDGSVAQIERIVAAGADIVRLTAQGVREAKNLAIIRDELRRRGIMTPLVADIHFNRNAAFEATGSVEKVRINPGNFVDPGRTFEHLEYTDEEYADELRRIDETFGRFLDLCRERGVAVRLGVNHGSLSDRIMSRYGDTPAGMVESVMEFLRVAMRRDFKDIVISIKASNVVVMVETVRLLVKAMDEALMHFPIHLGVTEAGDGEDARVKSAAGIGSLLLDGIGDTIRVSLSEAPEAEIPVARMLRDYIELVRAEEPVAYDAAALARREGTPAVASVGGEDFVFDSDRTPDFYLGAMPQEWTVISSSATDIARDIARQIPGAGDNKIMAVARFEGLTPGEMTIRASVALGWLLLNGYVDGIAVDSGGAMTPGAEVNLCYAILQATRRRITRTEYIACPGCGRTMFDLQKTLAEVKAATSSLRGLKIGVMGCIVNGPGEMADADYGYIGAGVGRVSLYRGKRCVKKNIPAPEAIPELLALLRADGVLGADAQGS